MFNYYSLQLKVLNIKAQKVILVQILYVSFFCCRKENPAKYWALEKRLIQPALPVFKPTLAGTVYSPVSPTFNTESPETTESTWKSPALPELFRPISPARTKESTEFRQTSTKESTEFHQTSPELNPVSYHTLTPLQWPFTTQASSSGSAQTTTPVDECALYPLREELGALCELVESIRTDFLQTSMIVRYIQDYLRKYK